jgi:hypothetical protein
MRVYYTRPLLRVIEGSEESLHVRGRLEEEITSEIEAQLKELPKEVARQFNFDSTADETIDYASDPIVYMPDEFTFFLDIESLGRLAREMLIWVLPLSVSAWESGCVPIAQLWVGGRDELLRRDEQTSLKTATRAVWTLPVRGKVFVFDHASLRSPLRQTGLRDAIGNAGGIVEPTVSPGCDYYVSDRKEAADAALQQGAKRVLDTLTLVVMVGSRD